MKSVIKCVLVVLLVFSFAACSSDTKRDKYDRMSYPTVFDALIMENISLDSLSKSLNIPDSDLIKIRYGLKKENIELTMWMRDLKYAYDENSKDKYIDLLSDEVCFEIEEEKLGNSMSSHDYKAQVYIRNEAFQTALPQVGYAFFNNKINEFIENQYSLWNLPFSLYDYVVLSKEEMIVNYEEELQKYIGTEELEEKLLFRINAYKNLLLREHEVLFHKKRKVTDFSELRLDKLNVNMTQELQKMVVERVALDAQDFAIDVLQETLIAFIVWLVISFIIELAIEKAIQNAVRNCHLKWDRGQGILKNICRNVLQIGVSAIDLQEEEERIKKKWRRVQFVWMLIISIALLVYSYYSVTQPSIKLEADIMEVLQSQFTDYFKDLNLWVLPIYNDITNFV